jgi:hypothetical protein
MTSSRKRSFFPLVLVILHTGDAFLHHVSFLWICIAMASWKMFLDRDRLFGPVKLDDELSFYDY